MKPMVKYAGGKTKELPQILKHIPEKFEKYIEPFVGGGALFFHLEPEQAIISDTNAKLIDFYKDVKTNFSRLKGELNTLQTQYEANQQAYAIEVAKDPKAFVHNKNKDLYYALRDLYNNPNGSLLPGSSYYFINKTAYSCMTRYNKKGEFNVPFGYYAGMNAQAITSAHQKLLQKADIYCQDYTKTFDISSDEDFIFLDPPYDCVFTDYSSTATTTAGFAEKEQRQLAEDFRNLSCKALLVINKTPLIEGLYGKYISEEYSKAYDVNIKNRFKTDAKHLIIKNY